MADDKGDTMTIKINETDLLALLGENGEHWLKGSWGDGDSMCLHGAIRRCSPVPGDAFLIEKVANRKGWGTRWNDDKATTWPQVRERLGHVEVTDTDLAETFGPQWEHVVALVRRIVVLTDDEARRLAAARNAAAHSAAGNAAWNAANAAARNTAARAAAREAAWAAAQAAAWDAAAHYAAGNAAARDAAWALTLRDLVGQHGFTQQHYDVLTGPWASVIGPVHPDDEARHG